MIDSSTQTNGEEVSYISLRAASEDLGVNRSMMYYYMKQLGIEIKKFPLDRKTYIAAADLERIRTAKKAAAQEQRRA